MDACHLVIEVGPSWGFVHVAVDDDDVDVGEAEGKRVSALLFFFVDLICDIPYDVTLSFVNFLLWTVGMAFGAFDRSMACGCRIA